jgi:hypothetical protein
MGSAHVSLEPIISPTKKFGIFEGSLAGGADTPTKQTSKAKGKSSKGGTVPKSGALRSADEGPSKKKKKKVQKRTPLPCTSPIRNMAKSMSVALKGDNLEVTAADGGDK